MKATFTGPRSKRLKLRYDKLLSSFAIKSNLRRYVMDDADRFAYLLDRSGPTAELSDAKAP
jgi:hypothetical protein